MWNNRLAPHFCAYNYLSNALISSTLLDETKSSICLFKASLDALERSFCLSVFGLVSVDDFHEFVGQFTFILVVIVRKQIW